MTTLATEPLIATPKPASPASLMQSLTGSPDPEPPRAYASNPIIWASHLSTAAATAIAVPGPMLNAGDLLDHIHLSNSMNPDKIGVGQWTLSLAVPGVLVAAAAPPGQVIVPNRSGFDYLHHAASLPWVQAPLVLTIGYRHTGPRATLWLWIGNATGATMYTQWYILIRPNPA